ncbi:MAG: hypothetical protein H7146_05610 [Burkholderiaceae bacterium]|nr:hypothetical protein [Microbacteriaceae bacterium]
MSSDDRDLDQFAHHLAQALQILDLKLDHRVVLDVVERATETAGADVGSLTAFYVGYAAGKAAGSGDRSGADTVMSAADVASTVIAESAGGTDSQGWSATAQ